MLIASIVGIGNRSTMDMDATIINYPLDKGSLLSALIEICEIKVGDDVIFNCKKVETILSRGELSTRPRDYYDVYVLVKTQNFSIDTFQTALRKTSQHRNSELIHEDIEKRIKQIESSEVLEKRWGKYTKDYQYANEITYEEVMGALKHLMNNNLD